VAETQTFRSARCRNKDREIEDIEEKHQDEIKVYKQKLKLLMYEQHVHLSEVQVSELYISEPIFTIFRYERIAVQFCSDFSVNRLSVQYRTFFRSPAPNY